MAENKMDLRDKTDKRLEGKKAGKYALALKYEEFMRLNFPNDRMNRQNLLGKGKQ